MKPSTLTLGVTAAVLTIAQGACDARGFGEPRGGRRLTVQLIGADDTNVVGTRLAPRALAVDAPEPFRIVVRAVDLDGNVDASYNGYVRISSKPGAIERIEAPDADGRSLKLTSGESPETEVRLTNAYGTTFILADDLGYEPADPLREPPPACANGVDDDGDGRVDFPADDGCAFANDDTETGGSYAQGSSAPIYYELPRVADARGLRCTNPADPATCSGSGRTPYQKEQLQLDTGYHEKVDADGNVFHEFDFDLVVTRIASDGFYVTDTKDARGGFNSIFAFNFNAPPEMRVCDRLKTFAGTATEFFGLTQISYPTWTLEEWDGVRPCLVPEARVLESVEICPPSTTGACGQPLLLPLTGGLVRALSSGDKIVRVTSLFGPGDMKERGGVFAPDPDATSCDFDKDGQIDFTTGSPEARCSDACAANPECTEYSNFAARGTFRLTVIDEKGVAAIQADASASADFNPLERKGQQLKAFSGTLHFFSGGSQYTIEARCNDDIVVDLDAQPLPSHKACVSPRTELDENPQ